MKEVKGTKSPEVAAKEEAPRRILPSFTLSSVDLPELKDWKVGEAYFLKVKVEQVSLGKGEEEWGTPKENDKKRHARFQILSIEAMNEKENFEDEYGRKRSKANKT